MNHEEATLPLSNWKRQLLADHGLSRPDGRPLYAYRLTEQQFETLGSSLCGKLNDHLKYNSLGFLSDSDYHFCALFILYAAEWWRRRY